MKKLLGISLVFSIMISSIICVNADGTSSSTVDLEVQQEVELAMIDIRDQLIAQNALDDLNEFEYIIYQMFSHAYNNCGIVPHGSEDNENTPPTYSFPNGGIAKYTIDNYRYTVTCLDRQQSFDYILGLEGGSILGTAPIEMIYNYILKDQKALNFIMGAVSGSMVISHLEAIMEARKNNGYLCIISKEDLRSHQVTNAVTSWADAPQYKVPSNATLWMAFFFEE